MPLRARFSMCAWMAFALFACGSNSGGEGPSAGTGTASSTSATSTGATSTASSTSATTGTTSSGTTSTQGSGGSTAAGSMAGASGSGGSSGGSGGQGGSGGGDAGVAPGDTPPWRGLNVTAAKMRLTHTFNARDADPAVTFNVTSEVAAVDPRSTKMVGKLVMPFGGLGSTAGTLGNEGPFVLPRGFHVLGIAAFENYNILHCDADFFGDARREVFDGVEHTTKYEFANVHMVPADGVAKRTEMALKYLHKTYPTEDWGYFLNQDGTVRWSDVIFTGLSHGASNAPRFAMLVRAWRSVSFAGPRDNSSGSGPGTDAYCPNLVSATWFTETPATPIDRFYTLSGIADAQHPQHLFAMEKLGYTGQPVDMSVGPPYNNSHRITGPGGHESPCNETNYKALCNYLFGVDPVNANGVP